MGDPLWPEFVNPVAPRIGHGGFTVQTERFSLSDIQQGNTPRQLNPVCKELYLHDAEFEAIFGATKHGFYSMKNWKQRDLKQRNGLF